MIDLHATQSWGGQRQVRVAAAADDLLSQLALWLADVTAEAGLVVRALEADSPLPDAMPQQAPAPAVPC
ncbi:MAG: hypothetical protein ACLQBX_10500 [Candidatus Limnocylindrales bacterium]